VVERLAATGALVSIDTRRASVARACLDAGARIVNDVSALRDDPLMLPLVAGRSVAVVLVHRRGQAEDRYRGPSYENVVEEVREFLAQRACVCAEGGVAPSNIVVDPGIGFGKSADENLALIGSGARLATIGYPVLIGSSRKGFIGRLTGIGEPKLRDPASVWLAIEALRHGAAIARVHNIAATRQALAVWLAIR
jgi:dihydropteroate synthase